MAWDESPICGVGGSPSRVTGGGSPALHGGNGASPHTPPLISAKPSPTLTMRSVTWPDESPVARRGGLGSVSRLAGSALDSRALLRQPVGSASSPPRRAVSPVEREQIERTGPPTLREHTALLRQLEKVTKEYRAVQARLEESQGHARQLRRDLDARDKALPRPAPLRTHAAPLRVHAAPRPQPAAARSPRAARHAPRAS